MPTMTVYILFFIGEDPLDSVGPMMVSGGGADLFSFHGLLNLYSKYKCSARESVAHINKKLSAPSLPQLFVRPSLVDRR